MLDESDVLVVGVVVVGLVVVIGISTVKNTFLIKVFPEVSVGGMINLLPGLEVMHLL